MRKPLQPSLKSRNIEQLQRRLAARANGWPIIPCEAKSKVPHNWTKMANEAADIEQWDIPGRRRYLGTGTRIEGHMLVIDLDVSIPKLLAKILAAYRKRWPQHFAKGLCIERTSGGVKLALFLNVSKPFGQTQTHKYTDDKALLATLTSDLDKAQRKAIRQRLTKQKVEIFGGSSRGRYFAFWGPHSPGREYACIPVDRSPAEVRLDSLPVFPFEDVNALIDIADKILAAELDIIPAIDTQKPGIYYDLEPGQTFITKEGDEIELKALEGQLEPGASNAVYGCMSWESWSLSESGGHCKAFVSSAGNFIIMDWEAGTEHRWKGDAPQDTAPTLEDIEIMERIKAGPKDSGAQEVPDPPGASDGSDDKTEPPAPLPPPYGVYADGVAWMRETFGLTEISSKVVRLYSIDQPFLRTTEEFHKFYMEYKRPVNGKYVFATREWLANIKIKVKTYDMRPDMPFPLYKFEGQWYKNIYVRPRHEGVGEVETYLRFMLHLVPGDFENGYTHDHVAHKWQKPGIPGHVLLMVGADDEGGERSGTGRGIFFKILGLLHGHRYTRHIDFGIISGDSSQATFTDWMADSVVVCVDEIRENRGLYGDRKSAYENVKRVCDPAPRWMTVQGKWEKQRDSWIVTTYYMATNHDDALLIPPSDRRITVISNGEKLSVAQRKEILAWAENPANIAALARWLEARNLAHFDMTGEPPKTPARDRMINLSGSEYDDIAREALSAKNMPGVVFTRQQLLVHMQNLVEDLEAFRGAGQVQFNAIMRKRARGLFVPDSNPKEPWRFRVSGGRSDAKVRAFVRSADAEKLCAEKGSAWVLAEIRKNGLREASDEEVGEALDGGGPPDA